MSVVIVNYNTRDATLRCLETVLRQSVDGGLEVILVDNASADGSPEAIRTAFPEVALVEAGDNIGFARGVNLGVHHSRGEYVLLLNPDTLVRPGAFAALLGYARAHPEHGVYGGRTLRPDGTVDPSSCWGEPTIWSLTCFAAGLSTAFKRSLVFDPESLGRWQRDSVREVPIVTGCLLLVRRRTWDDLGGMNETYFLYGEDAEFSVRARRAGLRPVLVPDAVIVHEVGGSTASSGSKMCMVMAGKATLLADLWRPWRAAVGIGLLQVGSLLRATLAVVGSRGRAGTWVTVWRRRRDWRSGYPHAEAAIFGRALPTT
jgi:GT2 family glycosyltransferase